jgi:N-acetylglucosaminyldiphosphoundecaprenol N-acetyl-beta-D-mannosaminyltransferase
VWDLLRARRSGEYHNYVKDAALVIPISKSIVRGAKFLHGKIPERYMPFNFTVQLLTILEKRENSVCLLGGNLTVLAKTEKNMRQTFPKLRIVGRFTGQFKKQDEDTILKVIRKSAPTLLLVGKGVHGEERWIAKNTEKLNKAFRLWCSDLFEVFAERRRRPGRIVFERGLEWIGYCLQSPFRFFRFFPFVCYNILLLVCKLKKR